MAAAVPLSTWLVAAGCLLAAALVGVSQWRYDRRQRAGRARQTWGRR